MIASSTQQVILIITLIWQSISFHLAALMRFSIPSLNISKLARSEHSVTCRISSVHFRSTREQLGKRKNISKAINHREKLHTHTQFEIMTHGNRYIPRSHLSKLTVLFLWFRQKGASHTHLSLHTREKFYIVHDFVVVFVEKMRYIIFCAALISNDNTRGQNRAREHPRSASQSYFTIQWRRRRQHTGRETKVFFYFDISSCQVSRSLWGEKVFIVEFREGDVVSGDMPRVRRLGRAISQVHIKFSTPPLIVFRAGSFFVFGQVFISVHICACVHRLSMCLGGERGWNYVITHKWKLNVKARVDSRW